MQYIACLLKQADPNAINECLSKMPVMVQRFELALYRSAPSFEAYCDVSTLQRRLKHVAMHILDGKDLNCITCCPVSVTMMKYRQHSNLLTWLAEDSHDALVRALGFLDVTSLLQCEMTSKTIKNAASNAWIAVDKAINIEQKAHGETPRQRAIRSSPIYRRHLLSEHAARVEKLRPTSSEAILYEPEIMRGNDYEFYIRFAKVIDGEKLYGEYEGPNRRKQTKFLAGGIVSARRYLPKKRIDFDLSSLDLQGWPGLSSMVSSEDGTFNELLSREDRNEFLDEIFAEGYEVLLDVTATIVAIQKKTLYMGIVLSTHHGLMDVTDHRSRYALDQHGMYLSEWEEDGDLIDGSDDERCCKHSFKNNKWMFTVGMEKNQNERNPN